jgi:uracil-DNA glycosylase
MNSHWKLLLQKQMELPYFLSIEKFLKKERETHSVFPPETEVFAALEKTSLDATKVVILGQDPYHGENQAHGLAFSVRSGVAIPPSLRNIFTELHSDVGIPFPTHGDLTSWTEQGVLLLNTTLTVRLGEAGSHHGIGWEMLTDEIMRAVNDKNDRVVFILWGSHARKKKTLITNPRHVVIEGVHPSPLSAYKGFSGSKPFSQANTALIADGQSPVDWALPA